MVFTIVETIFALIGAVTVLSVIVLAVALTIDDWLINHRKSIAQQAEEYLREQER